MKMFVTVFALLLSLVTASHAFATASSVAQVVSFKTLDNGQVVKIYHLTFVADSAAATIADVTVPRMHGFLMKAEVKSGGTVPTTGYSIKLLSPETGADALNNTLNSITSASAQLFYPVGASGASPLWIQPDDYTLHISSNAVNSATADIYLWFVDSKTPRP